MKKNSFLARFLARATVILSTLALTCSTIGVMPAAAATKKEPVKKTAPADPKLLEQKKAIIAKYTPAQKLAMENYAQPKQKAAYEAMLGFPLVTEAAHSGKTYLNIQTTLVVHDVKEKKGKQFFIEDFERQSIIAKNYGVYPKNEIIYIDDLETVKKFVAAYPGKLEMAANGIDIKGIGYKEPGPQGITFAPHEVVWQCVIDFYGAGKPYQIIMFYDEGKKQEGRAYGPKDLGHSSLEYSCLGDVTNYDTEAYFWQAIIMAFEKFVDYASLQDMTIPVGDGYYTNLSDTFDSPNVKRLLGFLKNVETAPWEKWPMIDQQRTNDEHHRWASFKFTKQQWLSMGWPAEEWHEGICLNERLQIPPQQADRPATLYGVAGGKLDIDSKKIYDYGPFQSDYDWWIAFSKERGKLNIPEKRNLLDYESPILKLFFYYNGIPRGTREIRPEGVLSLAELESFLK